ncbi:protein of unknown function [Acidithiobacillus ferrivorans]|uniref:Uncharacterized protein n=1 Tax=Acidithiobacillus ferrivorans TaxID=160808 RepID=A0A060UQD0_9PROT|nr:hypothetical protein AFERRI_100224 [Acidithiobacillus ferrivorans]SMH66990.1 protein of unknown function [Acidithiobacillus ferrivorans]
MRYGINRTVSMRSLSIRVKNIMAALSRTDITRKTLC